MPKIQTVQETLISASQSAENPALVLLEDTDPQARSKAHTTLGERAIDRHDYTTAEAHLREAIDLDPTDERPKQLLGELPREVPKPRGIASWVRGIRRAIGLG
jgi:Tfp pilus assembly protein PilF